MERKKILLVDDEASITDFVKSFLEQTGKYEVTVENNGAQAFQVTKTLMPDLILLDVSMPDMDGPEVAEALKNDNSTRNIPFVFLTSIVLEEETEAFKGMIGGHPFLAKPVNKQKLIDCIDQTISKSGPRK